MCVDLTEVVGRHGIEIAVSCAAGWNPLSSL